MPRMQCRACGGTYATVQGGTRYFHACPPIVDAVTLAETPRPGARNENIRLTHDCASAGVIADGNGTDPVPDGE